MKILKCLILVSRPKGWKAYLWMGILGLLEGQPTFASTVLVVYSLISYLATAFAVNNLFDTISDALNPYKNNPLNLGCSRYTVYIILANQILALALVSLYTPRQALLVYSMMTILAILYSTPPIRFKRRPGLDLLSHALFFGVLLFLYGVLLSNGMLIEEVQVKAVIIGVYSIFLQLRNTERDRVYDELSGDTTFSIRFPRVSRVLLYLSGIASALASLFTLSLNYLIILPVLLFSLLIGYRFGWERLLDSLTVISLSLSRVGWI